nr:type II toxin-antitoxin system VapC family toxin [Candidatus Njordarchaeota archaeon]
MLKLYVDSSVIVKRYIIEAGTELIDEIFDKAEESRLNLSLSTWNIGETLGALDEKRRRGRLSEKDFSESLRKFVEELFEFLKTESHQRTPRVSINACRLMGADTHSACLRS